MLVESHAVDLDCMLVQERGGGLVLPGDGGHGQGIGPTEGTDTTGGRHGAAVQGRRRQTKTLKIS